MTAFEHAYEGGAYWGGVGRDPNLIAPMMSGKAVEKPERPLVHLVERGGLPGVETIQASSSSW